MKTTKGKTAVPQPFKITDEMREWAHTAFPRLDIDYHTQEMVDWALANDRRYANWPAMWRNWMRRTMDMKPRLIAPRPVVKTQEKNVLDIAIQRMARSHGVDPTGKTESQIANEIFQIESRARGRA